MTVTDTGRPERTRGLTTRGSGRAEHPARSPAAKTNEMARAAFGIATSLPQPPGPVTAEIHRCIANGAGLAYNQRDCGIA